MNKSNGITRVNPVVAIQKHKTITRDEKSAPVMNIHNKSTGVATQKVRSVQRLAKPSEGGDTLMEWHKAKAKSSLSEAYRDADYATAGWETNSEWDDFVQFAKDSLIVIPLLAFFVYLVYEFLVYIDVLVVRL
jgi:predicted methyltransferase